jgi:pyruvate-formate lyase
MDIKTIYKTNNKYQLILNDICLILSGVVKQSDVNHISVNIVNADQLWDNINVL